MARRQIMSI